MHPDLILHVLDDPYLWVLAILVTAAAVIAGRIRRQLWWAVALTVVGVVVFLIGMKLLLTLDELGIGGALAGSGIAVWTFAITRRTPKKRPSDSG